jgi:UDP-3-O-[3-hydroxymyristoyl] glucosamine N-acyltransferase
MTGYKINDIAAALGAEAMGAADLIVTGVAEPASAGPDDLALAMSARYAADLPKQARRGRLSLGRAWTGRYLALTPRSSRRARATRWPV